MNIANKPTSLSDAFANAVSLIFGQRRRNSPQQFTHVLYEHFDDGTSRRIGTFTDTRFSIPNEEMDARFEALKAVCTERPSYEARQEFLGIDYHDLRGLRPRQAQALFPHRQP